MSDNKNWQSFALALIKPWEGLKLKAYQDSIGIWTIGYGSIRDENGKRVKQGDVWTLERAEKNLLLRVEEFAKDYDRLVTGYCYKPNIKGAVVSLIYNIGAENFAKSTMRKKLNAGDVKGAAAEFDKFIYAGGKPIQGLRNRRKSERAVFEK